jgi:hypothetical protein
MVRLIIGIVLLVFVMFAVIGILTDPAGALSSEGGLEGMVFVCLMLAGGVFLVYSGTRFTTQRRRTIECALQMLRRTDRLDTEGIAKHVGVSEIQVLKFLKHGQRKGILSDLDEVTT